MSEKFPNKSSTESLFVPESVPPMLAENFLKGHMELSDGAFVRTTDDTSTIWRCFEKATTLPNIGDATLSIDYKKYNDHNEINPEIFDLIQFSYNAHGQPIAEMFWFKPAQKEDGHDYDFNLSHRYVVPEFRNHNGLGTKLYKQAELWAKQIADISKKSLTLSVACAQTDVIAWVQKPEVGYSVYDQDRSTLEEITQHPERFGTTSIDYGNNQGFRDNFIYRKGSVDEKRNIVGVWFKKVIESSESSK